MDHGLLTRTDPTGFVPLVLLEQPGNDIEMPQSDPSKEQSLSSSTTSRWAFFQNAPAEEPGCDLLKAGPYVYQHSSGVLELK